ncbi:cell division protein FtsZ [Campylobacter sp. 19-13652]|uniref:cell division protein FtsZ n=1 Tax=Campylobacter sp. 19-13652 TaxID=2840180 RepID=UPI001C765499|nr:cell division protein FtsZ [Campylobacter sp. 19-13652]BCX79580.1 cell division protein FtsZ [Campylobacter sp. 19-13652]
MNAYEVEEARSAYGAKIKVIGVGGGGGNMLNHMIAEYAPTNIDLIVANTDLQALDRSLAHTKIQIGEKKTKGLGAGMKPETGREAAQESYEELKSVLEDSDIVFIATGLGGGTGTGASPVVAQAAKEMGAITVAVVTMPFNFEGNKRRKLADLGLSELRKESDSIVVIPNEKLLDIIDRKAGIKESFKMVDNVLSRAVNGMCTVILDSGKSDINIDFADVKTVMEHRGMALMGMGVATGDESAQEATKNAIQSPLLNNISIDGALGIIIHFKMHPDCPLSDIDEALTMVRTAADEDADIIFGTTTDENMTDNKVEVTIIATGFKTPDDAKEPAPAPINNAKTNDPLGDWMNNIKQLKVSGLDDYADPDKHPYEKMRLD